MFKEGQIGGQQSISLPRHVSQCTRIWLTEELTHLADALVVMDWTKQFTYCEDFNGFLTSKLMDWWSDGLLSGILPINLFVSYVTYVTSVNKMEDPSNGPAAKLPTPPPDGIQSVPIKNSHSLSHLAPPPGHISDHLVSPWTRLSHLGPAYHILSQWYLSNLNLKSYALFSFWEFIRV